MTTSGTSSFNETRDQIIKSALRKIGAIAAGETPDAQTVVDASDQLNAMVKYWMASGIHVWTETEAVLFTQMGQNRYTLGSPTSDQTAQVYTNTILTAQATSGAVVINVASTQGLTVDMTVGVTLASGSIFWTTASSFTSSAITLASPLTDFAQQGQAVYIAGPNIDRPLRVPAARRWDTVSNIETPLRALSRLDYQALPNKWATGTITQFFYDPRGGANNQGWLYLWPTPNNSANNALKFTWYRPIQDFNTAGDTPDLPQEWINALIWNLALEMAPEYGVPGDQYQIIKSRADTVLVETQGWDREPEPTYFGVDFTQMSYGR